MKNYLLLLLFIGSATFAQHKPKFGVNLGGTYANIRGGEFADEQEYDMNFLAGLSIEIPLNEKFSFVGNLNYERKTYKNTVPFSDFEDFDPVVGSGGTMEFKSRLEYLTIPLNLKYYIDNQKRFYVNGGPFAGFFLDNNFKVDGKNSNDGGSDNIRTLDFGANLGVGTNFKINDKNSLNLEIRHNYGLTNINSYKSPYNEDTKVKTNSFNLIANWQFDL